MALALTITKTWDDGKALHAVGTITASGSYTTAGDTLNFQNQRIKSTKTPIWVEIIGMADFNYVFVPGTTNANGKVKVITTSTGAEIAQAAYAAGVTGDTIRFHSIHVRLR